MIYLDTSVVMRLLVDDPEVMTATARDLVDGAQKRGDALHLSSLVIGEAYFVLTRIYQVPKPVAVAKLQELLSSPPFACASGVREILAVYRGTGAGLMDRLILAEARSNDAVMLTFDKAVGKLEGVRFMSRPTL